MADKISTTFPKIGKGGAVPSGIVDAMLVRGKRNMNERLGAVHTPSASYAPIEDPAASANLRNTLLVRPAKSFGDFTSGRQYGNAGLV